MNFDSFWQLLRYGLMIVGGIAVGKGWVTEEQVVTVVGAIGVIATVAWGVYVKWGTQSVSAATAARADVPTVSPVTGNVMPG